MQTDKCFDVSTYKRMAAGQLPAAEMETVYAHLDSCARCLQVVKSLPEPTLVAFMRNRIRPTNPVSMMFSCPGCREKLKVKKESAGQKVKCPKCGQMMQIPLPVAKVLASTPAARAVVAEANTVPPKGVPSPGVTEAPTLPPVNARTVAPVAKDDTRLGNRPDATLGADFKGEGSLTDFLAPPLEPDEIGRLGIYRVLKVLGAGGMGVVFKAEDPGLKRLVAIKAMLPAIAASASAKTRFLREAQAAAGIKHNHIVTIHQVSEDRGIPFLAMEFLEGESLDDRLKREPTLPPAEVLRIGREMAEGIAAAHERGLIHRDIKPANTWLESASGGRKPPDQPGNQGAYAPRSPAHVKILDFGLARATDDQAHLTQSGAIIGTPAYMAPEQARGEKLDARCDLWSLGVVMYRMCTGDVPFKGADTVSMLMAVAMNNPPPPAQVNAAVPPALSNLVMKLLEKDPSKRIGSAHELVDALRELEQARQATQAHAGPSMKPGRIAKAPAQTGLVSDLMKSPKRILLAITGVFAIVASIVVFWPKAEVAVPKGNGDSIGPPEEMVKVSPPLVLSDPKTITEKDIQLDFSYFEKLGLKVKDFTLEHDKTLPLSSNNGSKTGEYKTYRMEFLVRFVKTLSADELKEVTAVFNTFPGAPGGSNNGRGQSYISWPAIPPAPHKVIYWFYDKDNISVAQVYGRPSKVEGLISGMKDDVIRVNFDAVSFSMGVPPAAVPVGSVKSVVVRPIEKKNPPPPGPEIGPYASLFTLPSKITLDQKQQQTLTDLRNKYLPQIKDLDDQIRQQRSQKTNYADLTGVYLAYRHSKLIRGVERQRNAVLTEEQGAVLGINPIAIPQYATEKALNDPKVWDLSQLEKVFTVQSRSFDPEQQVISFMVVTKTKWTDAELANDSKNWGSWRDPVPKDGGKVQVRFYNKAEEFEFGGSSQLTVSNPTETALSKAPAKLTDKQAEQGLLRWHITINLEAIRNATDMLAAEKRIAAVKFLYPAPK